MGQDSFAHCTSAGDLLSLRDPGPFVFPGAARFANEYPGRHRSDECGDAAHADRVVQLRCDHLSQPVRSQPSSSHSRSGDSHTDICSCHPHTNGCAI